MSISLWHIGVVSDVGGIVMPLVALKKAEADENEGEILDILPKAEEPIGKPPAGEEMVLPRELA